MKTQYIPADPRNPRDDVIKIAARLIMTQELVAFPTETVYGLGAAAFSAEAVRKIFIAKDRPQQNPLLIHVSSLEQVRKIVRYLPDEALLLMEKFWPGPLSMVLPAREEVPREVRGGKPNVGIRMPDHPVALALIREAGPIAAPSANLSGRPSPVTADHVRTDLDGRIAAVLDAGATGTGLESTVVDLSGETCCILRRGGISVEDLEEVLGKKVEVRINANDIKHHQTRCRVFYCDSVDELKNRTEELLSACQTVGIVCNDLASQPIINPLCKIYNLSLTGTDNRLYSILREAEQNELDCLVFAPLPRELSGIAVSLADKIRQASVAETNDI